MAKKRKKIKRYPNGGIQNPNRLSSSQIDSTFNANRNVPFVNRMYNPDTSLTYTFPEGHRKYGSSGSHFLRQSDNIVYPEIQQQGDSLNLFEGRAGLERARQNKNYLQFKDEAEALRFSEQYKDSNTYRNFAKEYQFGGTTPQFNTQYQFSGQDPYGLYDNTNNLQLQSGNPQLQPNNFTQPTQEIEPYESDSLGAFSQGASTGAAIGSVVPGIGTAAGSIVGGILGVGKDILQSGSNKREYEQQVAQQESAARHQSSLGLIESNKRNALSYIPTATYPDGGITGNGTTQRIIGYRDGQPLYSTEADTSYATASFTPNELRPRTLADTRNTAINQFGISANEFNTGYRANPQTYTDSLAGLQPNRYKSEINSLGNPTLSEYIPNVNRRQTFQDGGTTHTMPDGTVHPGATHEDYLRMQKQGANAELETKEIFRTPDGEIEKVPEGTPNHNNGGVKLSLPEGTEILGKMKGKYNNKSYKTLGQDLKRKYDKYDKAVNDATSTLLAKNTARRMLDKVQVGFDALMTSQEIQKGLHQQFPSDYPNPIGQTPQENVAKFNPTTRTSREQPGLEVPVPESTDVRYAKGGKVKKYHEGGPIGHTHNEEPFDYVPRTNQYGIKESYYTDFLNLQQFGQPGGYSTPNDFETTSDVGFKSQSPSLVDYNRNRYTTGDFGATDSQQDQGNRNGTIGQGLGTAAQFAPAIYNLGQGLFGKADTSDLKASDYRNPYLGQIRRDLGDINYNIRPELEANELAYQTAKRNVRQVAPGTGSYLSNVGALAGGRMRADASAYARKQNEENRLRGQRAGIYSQLGAQEARTKLGVEQYNQQYDARAEAARQGFTSTSLDQFAGSVANIQRERNQVSTDAELQRMFDAYMAGIRYK